MKSFTHTITCLSDGGEAVLYRLCTNDTHAKHTVISLMDMGKYGLMLQKRHRGSLFKYAIWAGNFLDCIYYINYLNNYNQMQCKLGCIMRI